MLEVRPTKDGSNTVYNTELNTTYHSSWGALQESVAVFIENGLRAFIDLPQPLNILEIGFGTGLNAWLTWMECRIDPRLNVIYTGIEPFPVPVEIWSGLEYAESGLPDFKRLHQLVTGERKQLGEHFSACILKDHFENIHFKEKFHLIYFDAFDPGTQPELWNDDMMKKCAGLLSPGGIWISYCSKGDVRRSLTNAGLQVKKLKGPPGKRHILQAIKPL